MARYLGLIACVAFGCAGTTQEEPVSSATTTTSAVIAAEIDPRAAHAPPKPVETFTDDQILGLLATFNTGEIDLATIAQDRAHDAGVKRFASLVRSHHAAAREEEARLSERLVMKPASTDKMRAMQIAAQQEADKLRSLSGHDFDVEFVTNQVDQQRDCLAMLDVQLIPSARIADIRAHLASFRDTVDHHLRDGEELKRTIGGPIIAGPPVRSESSGQ
jgi:predicted outer membrane protein